MIKIKCTYTDGNTITTGVNGTIDDAEKYFLYNFINIGNVTDNVQQCIRVEQIA